MSADQSLEFELKATNEASAPIAQLKTSLDALKTSIDANSAALSTNTTKTGAAAKAHESMAMSVFKGVASWELLKEAAHAVTDFLEGSVTAFLDAQKSIDLTKSTIVSMGLSLSGTMPQIQEFGDSMVKMGVDGEDAELSAVKLAKAAGSDIPKGLQLAKLAADLASSGYGDLASNTDTLTSVLAGRGTAAIKQYRLAISDSATTAEILNAIQGKVTQTTEQYAQTIPGQIQTVKQAYTELQQAVGGGLVDAFNSAIKNSGLFDDAMGKTSEINNEARIAAFLFGEALVLVVEGFETVGKGAAVAIGGLMAVKDAMTGHFTEAVAESAAVTDDFMSSLSGMKKTLGDILNPTQALAASQKLLNDSFHATAAGAADVGTGVDNMNKKAQGNFVKLEDKLAALKDAYKGLLEGASTDLASLSDAHVSAMQSITASIAKTQKAISDLTSSYNQQSGDDIASVADTIVASQNKVADLKKQIAAATTEDNYDALKKQLDDEQKNLDSSKDFQTAHADAISAAQGRASETDLQRTIDSYNAKRALAQAAYQDQYNQLQQELADEQTKQKAEVDLYNSRSVAIKAVLDAANADYITLSNERLQQTTDEVNKEIQLFQQLAQAISSVKSASVSAVGTISTPSLPTTHKALGGSVMAGQSYIVGENGQEVFTPSMSGSISPNGGNGGGDTIVINMNGGYYLDENVADKLSDRLMDKLRRKSRIGL